MPGTRSSSGPGRHHLQRRIKLQGRPAGNARQLQTINRALGKVVAARRLQRRVRVTFGLPPTGALREPVDLHATRFGELHLRSLRREERADRRAVSELRRAPRRPACWPPLAHSPAPRLSPVTRPSCRPPVAASAPRGHFAPGNRRRNPGGRQQTTAQGIMVGGIFPPEMVPLSGIPFGLHLHVVRAECCCSSICRAAHSTGSPAAPGCTREIIDTGAPPYGPDTPGTVGGLEVAAIGRP